MIGRSFEVASAFAKVSDDLYEMAGRPYDRPNPVRCFALAPLLTPKQLEAVQPFMRATFTEMWKEICSVEDSKLSHHHWHAREALRDIVGPSNCTFRCDAREGRDIERALYARAVAADQDVVMGPPRS